jgi:hypothetical protein
MASSGHDNVGLRITVPPGWTIVAGKQQLSKVMGAAATEVAAKARAMIRAGARKRASQPGQPPHSVTGALARSIRGHAWRDGEGATIRASEYYAYFLSLGAKGGGGDTSRWKNFTVSLEKRSRKYGYILGQRSRMKRSAVSRTRVLLPRPFLGPPLDQVIASGLADRVRDAVMSGLKFQRGKK